MDEPFKASETAQIKAVEIQEPVDPSLCPKNVKETSSDTV